MYSRITIEIDFDKGNLPVIAISQQSSDDVRDKVLSQFLQSLQHTSRWLRIEYKGEGGASQLTAPYYHKWQLTPITPQELENEIKLMQAVVDDMKEIVPRP